ncbi:nucleoside diphosphate-linked moiety X motif 19 isoform X2 [Channa argus]|uniref:nucleoside diphosphate-linked moiety X motif 19 isoform X2 n=1 Tax=Channa argus TaxID=215402 RepID=UPI003522948C
MNTALKHWKEAATLILAAGHRFGADTLSARTPPRSSRFDYDVLLLKRSGKSGFMPNAYVFPGGVVDSSDFSSEWLDVFKSSRDSPSFGLKTVKQPAETRPPIFATDRQKLGSPIPGEVAFRICALRETFEESGVLLCVSTVEGKRLLESIEDRGDPGPHCNANSLCSSELTKWRALVNQNPSNFIRMCRELQVLPNIWALHEWSNWLTPRGRYGVNRFDTAFFICCLQDVPHTLQDEREIVHFQVIDFTRQTLQERLRWMRAQTLRTRPSCTAWLWPTRTLQLYRSPSHSSTSTCCRLLNPLYRRAQKASFDLAPTLICAHAMKNVIYSVKGGLRLHQIELSSVSFSSTKDEPRLVVLGEY